MLICIANATFKLYQIKGEIDQTDVNEFLSKYFNEESRINFSQMLKWCIKVGEISQYMTLINSKIPEKIEF
jgi:hypothetical protein